MSLSIPMPLQRIGLCQPDEGALEPSVVDFCEVENTLAYGALQEQCIRS